MSTTKIRRRYMMATLAWHQLGDISAYTPDLCCVDSEGPDFYVGVWVTGFGLINVCFPKQTTRPLTAEEVAVYSTQATQISSQPPVRILMDAEGYCH